MLRAQAMANDAILDLPKRRTTFESITGVDTSPISPTAYVPKGVTPVGQRAGMRVSGQIPEQPLPGLGSSVSEDEVASVAPSPSAAFRAEYPGLRSFTNHGGGDDASALRQILGNRPSHDIAGYRPEPTGPSMAIRDLPPGIPPEDRSKPSWVDFAGQRAQNDMIRSRNQDQIRMSEEQGARIAEANAAPRFDAQVYELDRQEKVLAAQERMRQAEFAADFFAKTGLPLTKENMALAENERKRDARDNDIEEIRAGFVKALAQAKTPEEELKVEKMYKAALRALTLRIAADDKKVSVNSRIDEKDDGTDGYR